LREIYQGSKTTKDSTLNKSEIDSIIRVETIKLTNNEQEFNKLKKEASNRVHNNALIFGELHNNLISVSFISFLFHYNKLYILISFVICKF
jgi:hypothetical protein